MTRKEFKAQRDLIKSQRKAISSANSRKQFEKSVFKARVGFVELFRAIGLGFKSLWILTKYVARDFVAFLGKLVVGLSDKTKTFGQRMDWNDKDCKTKLGAKVQRWHKKSNAKALKLSRKHF